MKLKVYTLHRPLSPHILIYIPQNTSLGSIWHRISGIILIGLIVFFSIGLKFIMNINIYNVVLFITEIYYYILLYFFSLIIFFYHMLNGFRHIIWDLGYLFKINNINSFYILFLIIMIFLIIINLLNL